MAASNNVVTSNDSEELARHYREEEEKTKAYYESYYGEPLKPRDRKTVQIFDINGQPLVIDGIGKDWRLDVTAEMMAYGLSEENADKVAFDWYKRMSPRLRQEANEEAEVRFNAHVLSKE